MMITPLLYVYAFLQIATAFPENLTPITILQNVPQNIFCGDDVTDLLFVQILKKLEFGGTTRIALATREKLYLLDSKIFSTDRNAVLNFTKVVTWKSKKEDRDICHMKGQPQEFCYNYLSILETKSDDVLILCGTNSYSPQCANYKVSTFKHEVKLSQEGDVLPARQISPFGPSQSGASLFSGDSLYSATYQSFLGGSPILSRTMGSTPSLSTETTFTLMKDPEFVKMTEIEDRILVFFNEKDTLPTGETRTISQVAQVCKNDEGGKRVLHRMFTTFLKSRLNCSYNGFYLDQVRDVTDPVQIGDQSVIFAAFATPDNSLSGSAICSFNLSSIHSAMSGPFLMNDDEHGAISGTAPPMESLHPGRCPEERASDSDLVFIRSHSQMEKHVIGSLLLTNQGLRWTAIAVDVISNLNNLAVLFIGTEDGHLIRALPPSRDYPRGKIISDQNVFDASRCSVQKAVKNQREMRVKQILIEGDLILVGFEHCIVSVPLKWCSPHLCKSSCLRSSDPYCAWNGALCVPFVASDSIMEQDINSNFSALAVPCQSKPTEEVKPVEKPDNNPVSTQPSSSKEFWPEKEESSQNRDFYSFEMMVIVVVAASVITLILSCSIFIFCYRCCCKKQKTNDPEKLNAKQTDVNSDEKHNSLSRTAQKTFCGMKAWIWKTTTPTHTPELSAKHEDSKRSQRSRNDYVPAPTVNQKNSEKPRMNRIMNSRLNSTSSTTSREDSVRFSAGSQPLLSRFSKTSSPDFELTLPKSFSDQSTLPLPPNSNGESSTSSGVSSQSSGSSPVFPENGNGAAESGVFPTASAKMRRRNENAARLTSEIMQETGPAMENFKDAFHNIRTQQVQGDMLSASGRIQSPQRFRLDSQDSGRGDSCRNSIRTECEQAFLSGSAKPQRPASLNINGKPPGRRRRLHSEGSQPYEHFVEAAMAPQPQMMRERKISGTLSNHSQASTPTSEHSSGFFYPSKKPVANVIAYPSLLKEDGRYKPQPRDLVRLKELKHPEIMLRQPIEGYFPQTNIPTHHSLYYYEPVSAQPVPTQYSQSNVPVNYYPSLQVRGAHAQPITMHPQKALQKIQSYPPQNYYSSLPATCNKSSHLNNRYSHPPNYSSLERQTTSGRKRQSVPLTRHTSMSATERPVGMVSPLVFGQSG